MKEILLRKIYIEGALMNKSHNTALKVPIYFCTAYINIFRVEIVLRFFCVACKEVLTSPSDVCMYRFHTSVMKKTTTTLELFYKILLIFYSI